MIEPSERVLRGQNDLCAAIPTAMVVPLPRLIRTAGWARIGLLVLLDADVIIVGDLLLLFVIPPVFLSCLCRLEGKGTSIGTAVVMFVGVDWAVRLARLARFDFGQAQSKSVVFGHEAKDCGQDRLPSTSNSLADGVWPLRRRPAFAVLGRPAADVADGPSPTD